VPSYHLTDVGQLPNYKSASFPYVRASDLKPLMKYNPAARRVAEILVNTNESSSTNFYDPPPPSDYTPTKLSGNRSNFAEKLHMFRLPKFSSPISDRVRARRQRLNSGY